MVKDFNAKEFTINDKDFMTNADVPTLALKDVVEKPVNPFTGKLITNQAKQKEQFVLESVENRFRHNKGSQFVSARWYGVKNNIWERSNWRLVTEDGVMPE